MVASLPAPLTVARESAPRSDHIVQFYDSEQFLAERVAAFVGAGLQNGAPAVVIATAPHLEAFCQGLAQSGIDVKRVRARGLLTLLDASDVLATFCGAPDWQGLRDRIGAVLDIAAVSGGGARIRVYAELVDLLWRDGQAQAALQLEALWNTLAETYSFSLLCAYVMSNFDCEADAGEFDQLCRSHSQVFPTEAYPQHVDSETCLREIAALQQRARSLESEIAQRKQLEDGLREALRFSETFVGMLGHDLRNPLSAITTAASLLTRRSEIETVSRPARRILSSAGRMARMIDQLLDFTRIRLGRGLSIVRLPVDLGQVCRVALDELSERARIELEVTGDVAGEWDRERLLQLVSSLVGNALTHGAAGTGVRLRVCGEDAERVRLEVHNLGVIPSDLLPEIFQPLQSSDDRKHVGSSGLGLGLYIARQIAAAHAGAIDVTSSEEAGTLFVVDLPRCRSTL